MLPRKRDTKIAKISDSLGPIVAYCILFCAGASGCVRTVQAWPPPIPVEAPVTVRFIGARTLVFEGEAGRDSVAAVREVRGRVVSLTADTLVLRVTRGPNGAGESAMTGRHAAIPLDSQTRVTRSEIDGWKVGYGILATSVLIFAILVLSGG